MGCRRYRRRSARQEHFDRVQRRRLRSRHWYALAAGSRPDSRYLRRRRRAHPFGWPTAAAARRSRAACIPARHTFRRGGRCGDRLCALRRVAVDPDDRRIAASTTALSAVASNRQKGGDSADDRPPSMPAAGKHDGVHVSRPTTTLGGAPHGDQTVYLNWAITASKQFAPLRDLGVEGATLGYGNMLPPLIMAALLPQNWFDPFLFMSTSLVAMTVLSLGLMLAMLDSAWRIGKSGLSGAPLWFVAALVTLAPRYPSWIVESPQVTFALPIVLSTFYLWRTAGHDLGKLGKALGTAVIGSAVSKVVMFNVLVPLVQ